MPVLGIGGLFFRSKDPKALSAWYSEHLGIGAGHVATPGAKPDKWSWQTEGGPVVFQPFSADTDYFAADKQFMLNLRVSDIDGLIASLRGAGIEVITKPEWNDPHVGKFARVHDPEGNAVELWEPSRDKA
jgi:predicted enzyme related to lactoylglutathione lyase